MAIDMKTLKAATQGDQEAKVALKRKWLTEVHAQLEAGDKAILELAAIKAQLRAHNSQTDKMNRQKEPFDKFDEHFDNIFGNLFGKGKKL